MFIMIEALIMVSSLVIMGYSFYMSSMMFWSARSGKGAWKWVYVTISVFILATYLIFSLVMFSFIANLTVSAYVFDLVNMVFALLLLSGAGLIAAMMKYHIGLETVVPKFSSISGSLRLVAKAEGSARRPRRSGKKASSSS